MNKTFKKIITVCQLFVLITVLFSYTKVEAAAVDYVVPINWAQFNFANNPTDSDAIKSRDLLLQSVKYNLGWLNTFADDGNGLYVISSYVSNNTGEGVRHPAEAALAVAVALKTGIYDAALTGVTETVAINRAVKMIKTLASWHKYNTPSGGWGNSWQSALWAGVAGQAGWMMWDNLDTNTKSWLAGMAEYESNRFNTYTVPYYRDLAGTIIYTGDSKGEENAWNAMGLQTAVAMMPNHPNISLWKTKCVELMVSSFARHSDTTSTTSYDGKALYEWLNGSNIEENGSIINHGIVHDDYMTSFSHNLRSYLMFSLAEISVPQSAKFNANIMYDALVDLNFSNPPYNSPGGTMYVDGSEVLYYPQGTDWSTYRFDIFYNVDSAAYVLGLDTLASTNGLVWERLRATRLQAMQARHSDGHLYASGEWNAYSGREQLAAWKFADSYLLRWLQAQGQLSPVASWNIGLSLTTVNDDDAGVTYSGTWTDYNPATGRINNDSHYSNVTGNYAQFTFAGTDISLIATKYSGRGKADVYIDSVYQATIDLYDPGTVHQQEVYAKTGLSSGSHTIKIVVNGTKNVSSTGYVIEIDAFKYMPIGLTTVNDDGAGVTYSGTWTDYSPATGRINNDSHYSGVTGNYAQFTFTGTEIRLIATKYSGRGKADVYIDSVYQATIDLYDPGTAHQQEVYAKTGLFSGSHTIKIVVNGTKNVSSTGYVIEIDAFKYQ